MNTTVKKIEALEELLKGGNITPTIIYNEGWMLRLVLNWLSEHPEIEHELSFSKDSKWFSEASLRTYFGANKELGRKDKLYETYTHADGAYGNIVHKDKDNYLKLKDKCKQFVVVEAKMFSEYSPGITCDKDDKIYRYDQVSRTVACMYESIEKSNINYEDMDEIAFYTFLPAKRKNIKSFQPYMDNESAKQSVKTKVKKRIEMYSQREDYENKIKWFNAFCDFLFSKNFKIELVTWEEILKLIEKEDDNTHKKLKLFYAECLRQNSSKSK